MKKEKTEDSKALMTQILVDTVTVHEKLKKEKKTVEKRVDDLHHFVGENVRGQNSLIADLKHELNQMRGEAHRQNSELKQLIEQLIKNK
jgi:hypothetical protein